MLGSQAEANEIFEYVQKLIPYLNDKRDNESAHSNFKFFRMDMEDYERGLIRNRPVFHNRAPYGPVRAKPELPEGWEEKGCGAFRRAYLSPSGVVYKVERHEGSYQSNSSEHSTAEKLRSLPQIPGILIPETALYWVGPHAVIAMEYVESADREESPWGECQNYYRECRCNALSGFCTATLRDKIHSQFGIGDLHGGNVLWIPAQRRWALVDMAG